MQLVIDQPILERELGLVAAAADTRSTIQSLSQVRLEAKDGGVLRLTANNLEYGLASEMEARVIEPGLVCLPARPFHSLVSALEGEVTIHTDPNCYARITAGRSRSRMPGEEANDFTELPVMPEGAIVSVETLVRLLSHVSFAVGRVAGRFEIPAALVRFTGDTLVCVATDERRLALAQAPVAVSSPFDFLFPSAAMNHVKKLIKNRERACVAADGHHLFVAAGSRLLAACRLAGSFPDYQRILPKFDTAPAEIDSAALRSAMTRVFLFTESGTRLDPQMRFLLRPGELVISAVSSHAGEGEDLVPCDYQGEEVVVGFNPRYIREFLDAVPMGKLRAWIKDAKTATEWRPEGDDSYRYVVMPVPVKE